MLPRQASTWNGQSTNDKPDGETARGGSLYSPFARRADRGAEGGGQAPHSKPRALGISGLRGEGCRSARRKAGGGFEAGWLLKGGGRTCCHGQQCGVQYYSSTLIRDVLSQGDDRQT